jgi:hypothetical protein
MGYKLPENVAAVSGLQWLLVAIPDDAAYRTAALGAYGDLAAVHKWGLEGIVADSYVARQQWLDAILATMELLEMDFPQLLLDKLDTLIAAQCPCGDLYVGPTVQVPNPDGIDYESGPVPDTWGEAEEPADLGELQDLICGAAHDYVDWLVSSANQLDSLVELGVLSAAIVASIWGALNTMGISLLVEIGLAAEIFEAITSNYVTDLFSDAASAIESARDDIICAMLTGDGANVKSAIEANVSNAAYLALYFWLDYQSSVNAALTGTNGSGEYLTPRLGEDCPCDYYEDAADFPALAGWSYYRVPVPSLEKTSNDVATTSTFDSVGGAEDIDVDRVNTSGGLAAQGWQTLADWLSDLDDLCCICFDCGPISYVGHPTQSYDGYYRSSGGWAKIGTGTQFATDNLVVVRITDSAQTSPSFAALTAAGYDHVIDLSKAQLLGLAIVRNVADTHENYIHLNYTRILVED